MADNYTIEAGIKLDGEKEFKSAVADCGREITKLGSESNLIKEKFAGQANSLEALKAKHEVLGKALEAHKQKEEAVRKGLDHAKESYSNMGKSLDNLYTRMEKQQDKLKDLTSIYGESSEEVKKQKEEITKLSEAIQKGETDYEKSGARVGKWETDLNKAEAQVIRSNRTLDQNASYLKEAEGATDKCATSIDKFGKEIKTSQTEIKNWGDGIKQHLKAEVIIAGIRSLAGVLKEGSQALVGLATDAAAYADEILTTSVVTRMSTDDLQAYNYAAELVDVSLDTLTKSMAKNVKSMTNAQRGSAEYVKAYERLGVSVTDGNGKLLDSETVYWKCIDALKNMTDETERDSVSMQIFGKSAQELNPLIAQGSEGIKKLSDEARKMGAVLDSDTLSALGATDDSLQRLYQSVDIFKRKVGAEMAPSITKASDEITKTIAGLDDEVADFAAGALEDAVSLFQWIIENHKVITSGLKGIVAGLVMYKAVDAITNVMTAMQALRKATAAAETAQLALNASQAINPYALLAAGITAVVVGIGSFIGSLDDTNEVLDENQQAVQNCLDQYSQLSEAVQKSSDSHAENITNLQQEYRAYDVLAQKLVDLSEKENKSAGDKALMASYVDQLNEKIPDLNLAIDETTGSLNMETDALLNSVSAMKQKAESAAWGERLTKLAEERIEIEEKRKAAMEAQTAAENKQKEAEKQHGITYDQIMEKLKGINSITVQKYELQKEDNKAVMDAADSVTTAKGAIMNYDKALEENGIKADEAAGKIKELGGAASETGDVIKEASEKAAEAASVNAEIQNQALEAVQSKFEETKASIQQSMEQKINMFDVFDGGDDTSVEKMVENLDSQLEGIKNYKDNLEIIKNQVGKTIAPEFLQSIEDMGLDGANMLKHMVATLDQDNGAELLKDMSDKYVEALDATEGIAKKGAANKTAMEIANGKLGSTKADFSGLRNSIDTAVSDATSSWSKLPDNTRAELDRVIQVAQESGVKIPDGLAESIKSGETSPTEAINQMNSAISGTFEGLVSIAQEAGITIPDGIKDGIASGGDAAVKAYQELIQLLQQTGVESETNAQQSGKTSAHKYAESMQAQSGTVKNAGSNVAKSGLEGINSHQMEFQNTGTAAMQSMANGVSGGIYLVQSKAGQAASDANNSAALYYNAFSNTGGNLVLGLANGFIANAPAVEAAARAAVAKAVAGAKDEGKVASPSKVFRNEVGIFLPKGMELGIRDGIPAVARSARDMAREAIAASRKEFDVNSPSRVFIKMGKNLGEGLEIGIKGKTKAAVKASSKMAKEVYKEASSWLTTYKKTHDVTLAQEESFWRKVARTVKKGTDEYKAAVKNANSIKSFKNQVNSNVEDAFGVSRTEVKNKKTVDKDAKKYYSELTKAATTYIENKKKTNKISLQQEKYFWEQVKKGAGETTQTYADASGKVKAINKKIKDGIDAENKKIEEKEKAAAEKAVSRLENSIASKKKYSSLTAAEETAMWDKLIKEAEKKGGKYLKVVQKQANAAKKEIEQANKEYGLSGSGLDSYKTYYNVSAKAEMEYWDIVRKNRKLTNAQRIEADQKYLEAKKSYNEQMKDLEDDYYDKCKDVSEKLADDIKEATEKYNEAVADRKDAIKSAFGMFDAFKSESESKEQLLANAESQAAGYALWMQQLEELSSKGIVNDKSMEELRKMGPEAAAHIIALNSMTEEELKQIYASWEKKDQIAEAQAVKENESLRKQTEENIKTMKAEAQKKLDAYKVEYDNASKVLSEAMEAPLKELANNALTLGSDATAKFILGVGNAAKSSDATKALKGATKQLAQGLESLPKAGKEIGKDTLAGILSGMSNKLEIKKGAKSIVEELEKAIKKEAGIHSPSKRFKESVGLQIPAGVAEGVEEGAGKASRSGAQMIRTMLEKSKTQLKDQQSALAEYSSKLNWSGGIEALNRIISVSPTQVQNIKVDNSGLTNTLEGMVKRIEEMGESIKNIKLVLDNGTLVGEIAPDMGGELAVNARRWAY
ncbi:phage tail tape measure protein [Robinsoniella peoriensis]